MSSLVIFSVDVERLAAFYEAVLGLTPNREPTGDVRLTGGGEEVLVHSVPAKVAKTLEIHTPPEPREGFPIKPAFNVLAFEAVLEIVKAKGGVVTAMTFTLDGIRRHDVLDPDGNVIQLRGPSS